MSAKSIISLAKLSLKKVDSSQCMHYCSMMLRFDPANYGILAKLISLLNRTGKLIETNEFLCQLRSIWEDMVMQNFTLN